MIQNPTSRFLFVLALFAAALSTTSCYHGTTQSAPPPQPPPPQAYVMPPPPPWAPPYEYRDRVRYYYLPDMECYYDVYMQQYVYFDGYGWIHNSFPPPAYTGYDMYGSYVVVLNYNVNDPWVNHRNYVGNYPRGYYNNNPAPAGTGNNTVNAPRRGYNENDKASLYHSTKPTQAPAQQIKAAPINKAGNVNEKPAITPAAEPVKKSAPVREEPVQARPAIHPAETRPAEENTQRAKPPVEKRTNEEQARPQQAKPGKKAPANPPPPPPKQGQKQNKNPNQPQ